MVEENYTRPEKSFHKGEVDDSCAYRQPDFIQIRLPSLVFKENDCPLNKST